MIKQARMFKTTRGLAFDSWDDCSLHEAADNFRVFLEDTPTRDSHALELARLFLEHDHDICNAWGLLYRIAETEPGKEQMTPSNIADRFKPQTPKGWKIFAGGNK